MTALVDLTVRELLDRFAAREPVPGGGSASALMAGLACGLGAMVARVTRGRKSNPPGLDEEMARLADRLDALRAETLGYVDRDAQAYTAVMTALKLPKETAEQKATRKAALEAATKLATEVPLGLMRCCAEAFPLLADLARRGAKSAASDVGVAGLALHAAMHGGNLNVRINLGGLADQQFRAASAAEADRLVALAARETEQIRAATAVD